MSILRTGVFSLLCVALGAQVRTIVHFDGDPSESLQIQGHGTFRHDEESVREGLAALRLEPKGSEPFLGVTISRLMARDPVALHFALHQGGARNIRCFVRVDDDHRAKDSADAFSHEVDAKPGWNDVVIPLRGVTAPSGRSLDFSRGISRVRISRRRLGGDDPGFSLDALGVSGEPRADIEHDLKLASKRKEGTDRARALLGTLQLLPEPLRAAQSLMLLKDDDHEGVRRVAREALATCGDDASLALIVLALDRDRGDRQPEIAWAMARMPSQAARNEVRQRLQNPKTPLLVRSTLIAGFGRADIDDVAELASVCGPRDAWPLRAGLTRALQDVGAKAVPALIEILARPGSPRLAFDAEEALAKITGKRLGQNPEAWRSWWKAQSTTKLRGTPPPRASEGYATFYGIPVVEGRVAFVLDLSGSMRDPIQGGLAAGHIERSAHLKGVTLRTRLDLAKAELLHVLEQIPKKSAVGMVFYSDNVTWATKGIQDLDERLRQKLKTRVEGLGAKGRTNIHDGMLAALEAEGSASQSVERGPDTVFLLTDGNPSVGPIRDRDVLEDAIQRWCLGRGIRIHTIHVGTGSSRWLKSLAEATQGTFVDLHSDPKRNRTP